MKPTVPTDDPLLRTDEVGGEVDGERVTLDRRTFVQLLAFGGCTDPGSLHEELTEAGIPSVLYEDLNDPTGVAIVVAHQEPDYLIDTVRPFLCKSGFASLTPKPEYTMIGRTYAIGYEKDLEETLLKRPIRRLGNEMYRWGVWYPLRRKGVYETLSGHEQHDVQMEHMKYGRTFAKAGGISDLRLASFGLDKADNDFVVALLGADLHPLSMVVQLMRKSTQTSTYLESLGPFFTGRVFGRVGLTVGE